MEKIPCSALCPAAPDGVCDEKFGSKECLGRVTAVGHEFSLYVNQSDVTVFYNLEQIGDSCERKAYYDMWHQRFLAGKLCLNATERFLEYVRQNAR